MSPSRSAAREYVQVGASTRVTSADPHTLILMLMNGALDFMAIAKGSMQRGAVDEKGRSLSRASGSSSATRTRRTAFMPTRAGQGRRTGAAFLLRRWFRRWVVT